MDLDEARERLLQESAATGDLDALLRRVEDDVAAERGALAWLRSRPTWLRRLAILASAVPLAIYLYRTYHFRPDADLWPAHRMGEVVLAYAGFALWTLWLATRPIHEPQPSAGASRLIVLLAVAVGFAVAAAPAPHDVDPHTLGRIPTTAICYRWGLYMGTPVLVAALLLGRERNLRRALHFAASAGLLSNLLIHIHCGATDRTHLLASHGTIALTYVALVLLLAGVHRIREIAGNRGAPPAYERA